MPDTVSILKQNLAEVDSRIRTACRRSGRKRDDVTLVAVTKYVDIDIARQLFSLGVHDLGESRPQELWRKAAAIPEARWHLVGHLQRNKVDRTLRGAYLIHSVDTVRLLQEIEKEATRQKRDADVLLEFNLSGEEAKHGFRLHDQLDDVAELVAGSDAVDVMGLMTMAALDTTPEQARPTFAALRQLRDRLAHLLGMQLPHLSIGMTNDFEVAIEEGATLLRIGSALFRGLETKSDD
jgi:pyridoxal phosphate enzyme (YggS family)